MASYQVEVDTLDGFQVVDAFQQETVTSHALGGYQDREEGGVVERDHLQEGTCLVPAAYVVGVAFGAASIAAYSAGRGVAVAVGHVVA